MSIVAYITLGLATILVFIIYAMHPDTRFILTALPMLLVLVAVPLLLNEMNKRQTAKVELRDYKLYKIKDLAMLGAGTPVRIRGSVVTSSLKWLNRPYYHINDESGTVLVLMFSSPHKDIKPGDKIETAGSLRKFGLSKDKRIWGVKIVKLS